MIKATFLPDYRQNRTIIIVLNGLNFLFRLVQGRAHRVGAHLTYDNKPACGKEVTCVVTKCATIYMKKLQLVCQRACDNC